MILFLFFTSGFILLWLYILYPLIIPLFKETTVNLLPVQQPSLSIVMAVYNEEPIIEKKLKNLFDLNYPDRLLQIIIIDGFSTDQTVSKIQPFLSNSTELILQKERCSKIESLIAGICRAKGEIILFTDADTLFNRESLDRMLLQLADPEVGASSGSVKFNLSSDSLLENSSALCWKIDAIIKEGESCLHSAAGLNGVMSAVRRSLVNIEKLSKAFNEADDSAISYQVIKAGYKIKTSRSILVSEAPPENYKHFFLQKVRIISQNITGMFKNLDLAGFKYGAYSALIFPTRRFLAVFSPWLIIVNLASGIYLFPASIFAKAALLIYMIIFLAFISGVLQLYFKNSFFYAVHYFVLINLCVLIAWFQVALNRDFSKWNVDRKIIE